MIRLSGSADVSTQSGERMSMQADIDLIADIRAGATAMRVRGSTYLPQYEQESQAEYNRRRLVAPWRPEFVDSLRSLASKPFGEDVTVAEDTPPLIQAFAEDVDGCGNNLTRFAHAAFTEALANGVHGILVDYSRVPERVSLADERRLIARCFWRQVPVADIIVLRTAMVRGREVVVHLRTSESEVVADGYGEKVVKRVRVYEPGQWWLWEQNASGTWEEVDRGEMRVSGEPLEAVPLVLFFTGRREGMLATRSPLRDIAEVQLELYRALSRQDEILTYCGSPMLAANGLQKPGLNDPPIVVGPKTVLFAPGTNDGVRPNWKFISPDAAAIGEIRQHVESIVLNMHRLAMQPTLSVAGGVTATASAINAAKAHSSLQAWARGFKDALEQAFTFTCLFLRVPHQTSVQVFSDFASGDLNVDEAALVLDAQAAGVISLRTAREELRRRNILGPTYDPAQEVRRLANERRSDTAGADPLPLPEITPVPGTTPGRRRSSAKV